ncbi:MAG TPA: CCA tRNA nucleotidyltransferase [Terriglobales bacterium]|nr:CCA tRNA nucleotidyltransferase [Terriglobales bacterium]
MSAARQFATEIVRTLRSHGFQAYFNGGCVRDLLLGREPADYDVSTDATPQQVMRIFPRTLAVGAQFGVVLVPSEPSTTKDTKEHQGEQDLGTESFHERVLPGAMGGSGKNRYLFLPSSLRKSVEVATFRCDIGYSDGRHPDEVRFTKDPREDVQRRDFTINGMLLDPLTDEILDFVGGREDLKIGVVRAIGEPSRRFAEDKLRMLRAVRFAARFEYKIEPVTFAAIQKLAPQIHQVSQERVREELTKMLTEGRARLAFLLLDESGLLHEVLQEISAMKGVEQPPQFHPEGDVFVHTLLLLEKLPAGCSKTLAWGALLHDIGKPATFRVAPDRIRFDGHVDVGVKIAEAICRRLRFSNDETEQIVALVDNHMRFAQVRQMNESTLKKFLRMPKFDEHLQVHRLDALSSNKILDFYDYARERLESMPPEAIRPKPLVSGDDLIAAGYPPGPQFKEILDAVEDAQLEGRVATHEAAMELVRAEFPSRGIPPPPPSSV